MRVTRFEHALFLSLLDQGVHQSERRGGDHGEPVGDLNWNRNAKWPPMAEYAVVAVNLVWRRSLEAAGRPISDMIRLGHIQAASMMDTK
ncbi:hypothetical protein [Streptosporangium sp. KLBMP 9127]|nr:hypothetical protein [Streptosporangium sp. KLBMP 9127]